MLTAPTDLRTALEERILAAIAASGAVGVWDSGLAEVVDLHDRDTLRELIAGLAIDGKLLVEERQDAMLEFRWQPDRAAPWLVRLAPEGTPSLEERIIAALAEAGVHGLLVDDLYQTIQTAILDASHDSAPIDPVDVDNNFLDRSLDSLTERGVIEARPAAWLRLSPAEWARRIKAVVDIEGTEITLEQIERLLAGTEPEPAAVTLVVESPAPSPVTPASPTLRDGETREG